MFGRLCHGGVGQGLGARWSCAGPTAVNCWGLPGLGLLLPPSFVPAESVSVLTLSLLLLLLFSSAVTHTSAVLSRLLWDATAAQLSLPHPLSFLLSLSLSFSVSLSLPNPHKHFLCSVFLNIPLFTCHILLCEDENGKLSQTNSLSSLSAGFPPLYIIPSLSFSFSLPLSLSSSPSLSPSSSPSLFPSPSLTLYHCFSML